MISPLALLWQWEFSLHIDDSAASGIRLAAVERLAVALALAQDHLTPAVRAARHLAFPHGRMSLLQVGDMALDLPFAQRPLSLGNHGRDLADLHGLAERTGWVVTSHYRDANSCNKYENRVSKLTRSSE